MPAHPTGLDVEQMALLGNNSEIAVGCTENPSIYRPCPCAGEVDISGDIRFVFHDYDGH